MTPRVSLTASLVVRADPSHPDTFTSETLWVPHGARGVFGGQVIAQALVAASQTTPLGLHSQHCYFLLAADGSIPIAYQVERLRDGKSYATRLVRAVQRGKIVFVLLASFAVPPIELPRVVKGALPPFSFIPTRDREVAGSAGGAKGEGAGNVLSHSLRFAVESSKSKARSASRHEYRDRYQVEMPDVLSFGECEREESRWQRFLDKRGGGNGERGMAAVAEYIQVRSRGGGLSARGTDGRDDSRRERNHRS